MNSKELIALLDRQMDEDFDNSFDDLDTEDQDEETTREKILEALQEQQRQLWREHHRAGPGRRPLRCGERDAPGHREQGAILC